MSPVYLIGGLVVFYIVNDVAADIIVLPMVSTPITNVYKMRLTVKCVVNRMAIS